MLTDFGIAKIVGASSDTMTGMWLGTPLYISPEQAQGYPGTKLSDIYALGVILYEICTGVCPFRGESVTAIMVQQISSAPTPPALFNPAIPPALTATILRAMAKDPAERFSSASALTAAIAEAFHLPLPAGLFLPVRPSNPMTAINLPSSRSVKSILVYTAARDTAVSIPTSGGFSVTNPPKSECSAFTGSPVSRTIPYVINSTSVPWLHPQHQTHIQPRHMYQQSNPPTPHPTPSAQRV